MPSIFTGANSPGMDIVDRKAVFSLPSVQTLAVPVTKSVATHRKGIGRS